MASDEYTGCIVTDSYSGGTTPSYPPSFSRSYTQPTPRIDAKHEELVSLANFEGLWTANEGGVWQALHNLSGKMERQALETKLSLKDDHHLSLFILVIFQSILGNNMVEWQYMYRKSMATIKQKINKQRIKELMNEYKSWLEQNVLP